MAFTLRISFFTMQGGEELLHVNGTTMVNSLDDGLSQMQAFAEQYHPEAADVTVIFNQRDDTIGIWVVAAQSNIDPTMYFVFVITNIGST